MIFNMTGGKKDPLNFQVKAYPSETELKADNPSENTIGVITTTTISSWAFSATEPTEPEAGIVWILVGKSSSADFNALKSNKLQVYPISAKQYVSSSWVSKTFKVYQNGTWAEPWNGKLFDAGNEYEEYTGGWESKDGELVNNKGITKGTDSITVSISRPSGNDHQESIAGTVKQIDLTEFNTLQINLTSYSSNKGSTFTRFGVYTSNVDSMAAYINPSGTGTFDLDVTALTGGHYVCFGCYSRVGNSSEVVTANMTANLIQAF